ncbi:MAG: tRNA (guanosine(37)-N1)-methyltransferase TrmD [Gammaproteobacteria bacterium RIFCSPHIGHO2_12_FULL_41_20]|nr:MAG: tRNA (guanosine(37)-N1)-methyltransferase TrmD [Gammaproteobacteria bacterium RIFCSPHIGHO2_12_FULL_41_20]
MWCGVITLFPEMLAALQYGITGKAIKKQLLNVVCWNPRDFTQDKHNTVDDNPYGGGAGMVMMAPSLCAAIAAARQTAPQPPTVIYLSPQGKSFQQKTAEILLEKKALILLAGRYEGIDERVISQQVDEEWSIGDYVLSGGELAAMVMIDVITRLIPGTVGDEDSITQESLTSGLLKYPQYTRPEDFQGARVPDVLLSGNHAAIARWRLKQALGRTWLKRPDLLAKKPLSNQELELLMEFVAEQTEIDRGTDNE